MEYLLLFIVVALLGIIAWLVFRLFFQRATDDSQNTKIDELKGKLERIEEELKGSSEKNLNFLERQTEQGNKILQEVTRELTSMKQGHAQILDSSNSLIKILGNPKQRGNLGEFTLEALLAKMLPADLYKRQYPFKNGSKKVDFAVFYKDKIIPIDAKFSLENYNRIIDEDNEEKIIQLKKIFYSDLKKRIDETAEYIIPKEGTTEYALTFIPSDALYYDVLNFKQGSESIDLIEYAHKKKVVIVSPSTLYAMLENINLVLNEIRINKSVELIKTRLANYRRHVNVLNESFGRLGASLSTTVNHYESSYKTLSLIEKDITKIAGGESTVEPMRLDKPKIEE